MRVQIFGKTYSRGMPERRNAEIDLDAVVEQKGLIWL